MTAEDSNMEDKRERRELRKKFNNLAKCEPIEMVPIKEIAFCNICPSGRGRTFLRRELLIRKEGKRWVCCRNRVRLFYELELQKFFRITDPRQPFSRWTLLSQLARMQRTQRT